MSSGGPEKPAVDSPKEPKATPEVKPRGDATTSHASAEGEKKGGKSPLRSEFEQEARAAWEKTKKSTGGFLLHEKEPIEEVSGLKTPIYMIRDWVNATVGNVLRRGKEIIQPAGAALEAGWNTISKPFLSPVKTLFHPIKYLSNIPRIGTAGLKAMKNLYKAPVSAANEGYQGLVQDPLERVDYKVAKLGKVGRGIATFNNKVASVLGWPMRTVDDIAKWATNWIDDADQYIGGVQGA